MTKISRSRLALNATTIRVLTGPQLSGAYGGIDTASIQCTGTTRVGCPSAQGSCGDTACLSHPCSQATAGC